MAERCKFCAKKVNDKGYCENKKCPDNFRREIIEKAEPAKIAEAKTNE